MTSLDNCIDYRVHLSSYRSCTIYSAKDAKRYLAKYRRLDQALDAYFNSPTAAKNTASTSKLNALFDQYKGKHTSPNTIVYRD